MRSMTGLIKKDFRLTRTIFIIGLVINFLVLMLALYVDMSSADKLFMFAPLLFIAVMHILYFPIMMLFGLSKESRHLHLWLHNPQSAVKLLLSKITNSIFMILVSLVMIYTMAAIAIIPKFRLVEAYWADVSFAGLLIFFHIILISIFLGAWVTFIWTLYQYLSTKIGRWSWFGIIGLVLITIWISIQIETTKLYIFLTQWGSLDLSFSSFTFEFDPIQLYTGEYVYNFLIIIGLFYLSTKIIDNKLEV